MLIKSKFHQSGITLIELIIASAIGLAVLSSTIALFSYSTKINSDMVKMTRLNQELRAIMDIMVRDIRRAGYWREATTMIGAGTNTNPFSEIGTGSPITPIQNNVPVDCILFYYDRFDDRFNDGTVDNTPSPKEKFGFKLNNNKVDMRKGGDNALSCTYASDNQWEGISDPNVTEITALTFTPTLWVVDLDGISTVTIREITISITGKLVDGEFPVGSTSPNRPTRTLTQTVRVRNDLFTPSS